MLRGVPALFCTDTFLELAAEACWESGPWPSQLSSHPSNTPSPNLPRLVLGTSMIGTCKLSGNGAAGPGACHCEVWVHLSLTLSCNALETPR